MSVITEIIVWVSPVLVGVLGWLLIDLYKDLKTDVKELRTSNSNVRNDLAKQSVQITSLDSKLTGVCRTSEAISTSVHDIDKRTANVHELNGTISKLSSRLDDSDRNYGKILMILNGVAKRIGIDVKKSGQ